MYINNTQFLRRYIRSTNFARTHICMNTYDKEKGFVPNSSTDDNRDDDGYQSNNSCSANNKNNNKNNNSNNNNNHNNNNGCDNSDCSGNQDDDDADDVRTSDNTKMQICVFETRKKKEFKRPLSSVMSLKFHCICFFSPSSFVFNFVYYLCS